MRCADRPILARLPSFACPPPAPAPRSAGSARDRDRRLGPPRRKLPGPPRLATHPPRAVALASAGSSASPAMLGGAPPAAPEACPAPLRDTGRPCDPATPGCVTANTACKGGNRSPSAPGEEPCALRPASPSSVGLSGADDPMGTEEPPACGAPDFLRRAMPGDFRSRLDALISAGIGGSRGPASGALEAYPWLESARPGARQCVSKRARRL